jgi:hypothetical protein
MPPETTILKVNIAPAAALVHHFDRISVIFNSLGFTRARIKQIKVLRSDIDANVRLYFLNTHFIPS